LNISKITNRVAMVTVVLLVYWVFAFVCIQVFGFKVFRENLTQIFAMSILGIFAVLGGAIILNVMFNLTAIAERHNDQQTQVSNLGIRKKGILFVISLVVIFSLLFIGDLASSNRKERRLVAAAKVLVEEQKETINRISKYNFSADYLSNASAAIKFMSKIDENFPKVTAIVRDKIDGKPVLLGFSEYYRKSEDTPQKVDYILSTSAEERNYLNAIFDDEKKDYRFSSNDGRYEIYFPVNTDNDLIVFHLSEYSRYGKFGS
jgi:hypothetical protein